MDYVVGFPFIDMRPSSIEVFLVEKFKPVHHRGLLNGIGGKIERGESPNHAILREYYEETIGARPIRLIELTAIETQLDMIHFFALEIQSSIRSTVDREPGRFYILDQLLRDDATPSIMVAGCVERLHELDNHLKLKDR